MSEKIAGVARRPRWAWWGGKVSDVNPRHAVRILRAAAGFEELIWSGGPPLDRALQAHTRARRNMGRNDRAVLAEAVYHLARNREAIRRALPDAMPGDGDLLLLAFLDRMGLADPGKVPHLPGGVAPWLQALGRLERLRAAWVERIGARQKEPIPRSGPVREALEALFSVPGWWFDLGPWDRVGEAVRELARLRRPQELTLRAQAHRTDRGRVLRELREAGVPARPTDRSPWGVRVAGRHNVLRLPLIREGRAEVQDEGSQLVACLCDPKPREKVLDFCAGGGGKALALAAAMGGRGRVVAHDADPARLRDTRRRARRGGLGNIRVEPSAEQVGREAPYDLILVDVPCSSSGTLRRNPDAAWRWTREDLARLTRIQAEILDRVAPWVRPGGFLVYVTCSLLEPENRRQIESFLARHPGFEPAPLGDRTGHAPLLDVPGADRGVLRLPAVLPRYGGDAFFLARLRKDGS